MTLAPGLGRAGAPGIRSVPPEPVGDLTGVRRDVPAFLGVAPRGPAWMPSVPLEPDVDVAAWLAGTPRRRSVPVAVTSWDEYRRRFGGFEGPGRLPYAVSAFFAAGGRRAYVVRIVSAAADLRADAPGRSGAQLGTLVTVGGAAVRLRARSEGSWGNRLGATLRYGTRPLACTAVDAAHLVLDRREWVPGGSLLRLGLPGDVQELRYVASSVEEPDPAGPGRRRVLTLAVPAGGAPTRAEVVTASLEVRDADPGYARTELVTDLGLHPDHPRWLARVLVGESELAWPDVGWAGEAVVPADPTLGPVELVGPDGPRMSGGEDRWDTVVPEDFWDPSWVPGDESAGGGVHSLAEVEDVGLVVTPDLYEPAPLVPRVVVPDQPTLCGPEFSVHVEKDEDDLDPDPVPPMLTGLALDPRDPAHLVRIVDAQRALVTFADTLQSLTVLLDVPPGLPHRRVLEWRTAFDSPFAAAYHPWLDVSSPDDARDALVRLNPSAFAAGILAERELRLGVQYGPANEPARGALRVADDVPPERHDELHPAGINVFLAERDGIRLTGARTLSRRPELRQLSVARLMTVLRLTLQREMDWAVFEPNGAELWAEVRRLVDGLLTRLFEAGAFTGGTPEEAFFVRCDRTTMTRNDLDSGRLVCLVGVAPAEPLEYLLLEVALAATSGVRVEIRT